MLCDMAVNDVPILFHISCGAPDLPVTSPKEKDSHQLKEEATEFLDLLSCSEKVKEIQVMIMLGSEKDKYFFKH